MDRYSKHYFTDDVLPDYVKEKGNTNTPPAVSFFVGKQWVYECSEEDAPGYNSRLMFLFDGSSRTNWVPEKKSQARTYVIGSRHVGTENSYRGAGAAKFI